MKPWQPGWMVPITLVAKHGQLRESSAKCGRLNSHIKGVTHTHSRATISVEILVMQKPYGVTLLIQKHAGNLVIQFIQVPPSGNSSLNPDFRISQAYFTSIFDVGFRKKPVNWVFKKKYQSFWKNCLSLVENLRFMPTRVFPQVKKVWLTPCSAIGHSRVAECKSQNR